MGAKVAQAPARTSPAEPGQARMSLDEPTRAWMSQTSPDEPGQTDMSLDELDESG